jgi:hypothetical protein
MVKLITSTLAILLGLCTTFHFIGDLQVSWKMKELKRLNKLDLDAIEVESRRMKDAADKKMQRLKTLGEEAKAAYASGVPEAEAMKDFNDFVAAEMIASRNLRKEIIRKDDEFRERMLKKLNSK